jgi:ABC-2 type transport system permease protein
MGISEARQDNHGALLQLPGDLIASRELLIDLVRKDLRVRYRYAALGLLWAVFEPLAYMVVLTFIFEWVLAPRGGAAMFGPDTPFAVGLLSGLIFWQFSTQSISAATSSLLDNQNLVKKVAFTREVIPLAVMGYPAFSLGIGFVVLLVVHLALGGVIGLSLLWFLPVLFLQLAITVGVGLFAAALNVRFRDIGYMVNVALLLGFYASPVFYDLDWVLAAAESGALPRTLTMAYLANPMTELLEAYRQALLEHRQPDLWLFGWPTCCAVLALTVGATAFRRGAPTLSDYL